MFRTEAAKALTTVVLLRERIHLTIPGPRPGTPPTWWNTLNSFAYTGSAADAPRGSTSEAVAELLDAQASAVGADRLAQDTLQPPSMSLPALADALERFARPPRRSCASLTVGYAPQPAPHCGG